MCATRARLSIRGDTAPAAWKCGGVAALPETPRPRQRRHGTRVRCSRSCRDPRAKRPRSLTSNLARRPPRRTLPHGRSNVQRDHRWLRLRWTEPRAAPAAALASYGLCLLDKEHGAHPHKLWSFWSQSPRDVVPLPGSPAGQEHMEVAGADFRRREQLGRLKYATVMSDEFRRAPTRHAAELPGVDIISSASATWSISTIASPSTPSTRFSTPPTSSSPPPTVPQDALRRPRFPIVPSTSEAGSWRRRTTASIPRPSRSWTSISPSETGPPFYVLPFSERRALFEYTVFSPPPRAPRLPGRAPIGAVSSGLTDYDITREEYGNIPMTDRHIRQRWSPRVFNIGVVGGMSKPTTGYAFHRIQRQVEHPGEDLE